MGSRTPIWIAVAGNCVVAAVTYSVFGWNAVAAHAAARNTARFSVMWLTVGFAAPGLVRFVRALPAEARLIQAFVSAHLVHFATVGLLLGIFEWERVAQNPVKTSATVLIGAGAVIATGLTATPRPSRIYTSTHSFTLYVVFLIFFTAYLRHPVKPMRLAAVPLGLALLLRLTSRLTLYSARARAAD